MGEIWIVVSETGEAEALAGLLLDGVGGIRALAIGSREVAEDASRFAADVAWFDSGESARDCFVDDAARLLCDARPSVMAGVSSPVVRSVLGKAAFELGCSVVSNVVGLSLEGDTVVASCSDIDEKLIRSLRCEQASCLLVNSLSASVGLSANEADITRIRRVDASAIDSVRLLAVEPVPAARVEAAKRVVSIGRGAASRESFDLASELARAIGAELGCSMPVVKDTDLMPDDVYIGISGKHIAPDLYIALGVSGVFHHAVGVKNAKNIVCVNKDPRASFFDFADYGIVGDVGEVVPELIKALG